MRRLPFIVPAICLLALGLPLARRAIYTCAHTQMAMHDRYLEHIQPARFLREYYPLSTVVVNDIGAVAYFTDCRLLDMFGLGNMEPVNFRLSKAGYRKKDVMEWADNEGAEIAILKIEWDQIFPRIPDSWVKVSEWETPRNIVFGDKLIGFFAIKAGTADALARNISTFAVDLPKEVKVKMRGIDLPISDAGDGLSMPDPERRGFMGKSHGVRFRKRGD